MTNTFSIGDKVITKSGKVCTVTSTFQHHVFVTNDTNGRRLIYDAATVKKVS